MNRIWGFVAENSVLLVSGAAIALIWANIDYHSYHSVVDFVLWKNQFVGAAYGETGRVLSVHYLVNDILMAFFFGIAAKEVWEAMILKSGSLRGKKALTPLFATAGGMIGPVAVYLGIAAFLGSETYSAVANGWAIPTATDIAFSYLVGRVIYGAGHPAVRFLLLLAIADDAAGLIILAVFYPTGELALEWLLLSVGAAFAAYFFFNYLPKRLDAGDVSQPRATWVIKNLSFWPYAVAGALSWYGFQMSGIHPALGLLPVVAVIPHADRDFGFFAELEVHQPDLLNKIEHGLKIPIEFVLFLFGLMNAGVELSSIGTPTTLVLLGLLVGKPIGILFFGWIGAVPLRLGMPPHMRIVDLLVVGFIAAIGFTVSLFIATVAFEAGPVQDAAKMGALLSLGACVFAFIAGKMFRVERKEAV
ncbi:MAG: Na+/H+ antiporter NhaA [Albidovulum sp.]|nr:Na+/H+ antiporter NhaA [Albidovulum sp.]MDE0530239.1 Na+/H+ antiporter NhaA [Albidovulum sp.]